MGDKRRLAPRGTKLVRPFRAREPRTRKAPVALNVREILSRAVERGIARGFVRAESAAKKPTRDTISEHVFRETMVELGEVLVFDGSTE